MMIALRKVYELFKKNSISVRLKKVYVLYNKNKFMRMKS